MKPTPVMCCPGSRTGVVTRILRLLLLLAFVSALATITITVALIAFDTSHEIGTFDFYLALFTIIIAILYLVHAVPPILFSLDAWPWPQWISAFFELFALSTTLFAASCAVVLVCLNAAFNVTKMFNALGRPHENSDQKIRIIYGILDKDDQSRVWLLAVASFGIFWIQVGILVARTSLLSRAYPLVLDPLPGQQRQSWLSPIAAVAQAKEKSRYALVERSSENEEDENRQDSVVPRGYVADAFRRDGELAESAVP